MQSRNRFQTLLTQGHDYYKQNDFINAYERFSAALNYTPSSTAETLYCQLRIFECKLKLNAIPLDAIGNMLEALEKEIKHLKITPIELTQKQHDIRDMLSALLADLHKQSDYLKTFAVFVKEATPFINTPLDKEVSQLNLLKAAILDIPNEAAIVPLLKKGIDAAKIAKDINWEKRKPSDELETLISDLEKQYNDHQNANKSNQSHYATTNHSFFFLSQLCSHLYKEEKIEENRKGFGRK